MAAQWISETSAWVMFTEATHSQKCSSPGTHTLQQQSTSAKCREKQANTTSACLSLDNHLTTSPSRWRISSNAEQTKLTMHAGICRTTEPQNLLFWLQRTWEVEKTTQDLEDSLCVTAVFHSLARMLSGDISCYPCLFSGNTDFGKNLTLVRGVPLPSQKYPQTFHKPASASLCLRAATWTVKICASQGCWIRS